MADRKTVPGSDRRLEPGHRRVGDVDGASEIEVTLYVRGPRAEYDDLAAVSEFASEYGLELVLEDQPRRAIRLRGTADAIGGAFEAQLKGIYEHPSGVRYRGRRGHADDPGGARRGGHQRARDRRPPAGTAEIRFAPRRGALLHAGRGRPGLSFPAQATGDGETVGIVELGGGFGTNDLNTYFQGLGLTPPNVTAVSVDGGQNSPGIDTNADGEVMLDIEVVGAIAPAASIVVYFAPNTDAGFIDAVSTAVHDTDHRPSVVSISWGETRGHLDRAGAGADGADPHRRGRARRHGHGGRG